MNDAKKKITGSIACVVSLLLVTTMMPTIAFGAAIYTDARAKALAKNVVGKSAIVTEVDSDYENGALYYEVDLRKGNKKYELVFKAKNSKLVEYKWEFRNKGYQQRYGKNLPVSKIKNKAKRYISGADVTSTRLTTDDGIKIYKVIMKKGTRRYTLEYNAKSGKLLEYQWKTSSFSTAKSNYIGLAKAKSIAKSRVPGATIVKCNFEMDDGVPTYQVEMIKGNFEYEIVVHAKTGKILEYDRDYLYD